MSELTTFYSEAKAELARRGITGDLVREDIVALAEYQEIGMTGVEAGAQLAMDIIRAG